jgi:hypothetical protein
LTRIESEAFSDSSLRSILIPSSVEIIGSECFFGSITCPSISFESPSQLKRLESYALYEVRNEVVIPSTILFIAFNAIHDPSKILLADCESCPEFLQWQRLRLKGIEVDFRRILRLNSDLPDLTAYQMDLSIFKERTVLNGCQQFLSESYERLDDGCLIVVKSITLSDSVDGREIEKEIEKEMNLRHPCIAGLMGFVFSRNSSGWQELKIGRLFVESGSLAEILSVRPEWWTPTAKMKAIVGILLGLRFAHSLGLIHGHLTSNNIFFDGDHQVQIADFGFGFGFGFGFIGFEGRDPTTRRTIKGFSGDEWTPQVDIQAFLSLLTELVIVDGVMLPKDGNCEGIVNPRVPEYIFEMIDKNRSDSAGEYSVDYIISTLKAIKFEIVAGVDSAEVLAFVEWVEKFEESTEINNFSSLHNHLIAYLHNE